MNIETFNDLITKKLILPKTAYTKQMNINLELLKRLSNERGLKGGKK